MFGSIILVVRMSRRSDMPAVRRNTHIFRGADSHSSHNDGTLQKSDCVPYRNDMIQRRTKIFSDVDGVKEFRNDHIDKLLRDITVDIQLALDEFSNRQTDTAGSQEQL